MLRRLARALTSAPAVYDLVQDWVGGRRVYAWFADMLPRASDLVVVDAGAGTGRLRQLLDPAQRYVPVELDLARLASLQRTGAVSGVVGDVRALPLAARSADVVCCVFVAHHLDDGDLRRMLREAARVTRGTLLVLDPLWMPRRLLSRVLWRYDQGSYPRTPDALRAALLEHFIIDDERRHSILHAYGAWRCRARQVVSE